MINNLVPLVSVIPASTTLSVTSLSVETGKYGNTYACGLENPNIFDIFFLFAGFKKGVPTHVCINVFKDILK